MQNSRFKNLQLGLVGVDARCYIQYKFKNWTAQAAEMDHFWDLTSDYGCNRGPVEY